MGGYSEGQAGRGHRAEWNGGNASQFPPFWSHPGHVFPPPHSVFPSWAPTLARMEPVAPARAYLEPRFEHLVGMQIKGVVRSWKSRWGFIVSDSYDGDLHAHSANIVGGFDGLPPGAPVSFELGVDSQGRTTPLNIQTAKAKEDLIDTGIVIYGFVRNWKADWGFIVAPEAFEGDLFCHVDCLVPGITPGMVDESEVQFSVGMDRKGRPVAQDVRPISSRKRANLDSDSAAPEQ